MTDVIARHPSEIGNSDWFVQIKVTVQDSRATMIYRNDNEYARQEMPYTDFLLDMITLYARWDGEDWVIMLTSEY
jgi:hypothetical protein